MYKMRNLNISLRHTAAAAWLLCPDQDLNCENQMEKLGYRHFTAGSLLAHKYRMAYAACQIFKLDYIQHIAFILKCRFHSELHLTL